MILRTSSGPGPGLIVLPLPPTPLSNRIGNQEQREISRSGREQKRVGFGQGLSERPASPQAMKTWSEHRKNRVAGRLARRANWRGLRVAYGADAASARPFEPLRLWPSFFWRS